MPTHTITLDDDALATIRSALVQEIMKAERAVLRGDTRGIRLERLRAIFYSLPKPE